jgi:hypothetical protein
MRAIIDKPIQGLKGKPVLIVAIPPYRYFYMRWLHTPELNGYDREILQSPLGQLEFLQDEEESADSTIAKGASHGQYVPMSMTGFDHYRCRNNREKRRLDDFES